jgi:hypothetical protein
MDNVATEGLETAVRREANMTRTIEEVADEILRSLVAAGLHDKATIGELRETLADMLHEFEADCLVRVASQREPVPRKIVKPAPERQPVMNERDAAVYTGMSAFYLRSARRAGKGPTFLRLGRSIRYRVSDLDEWLGDGEVSRPRHRR